MVGEDEEDSNKELGLNMEDPPLSPTDWIMFLSWEISDRRMRFLMYVTILLTGMFVSLGSTVALMISDTIKSIIAGYILVVFVIILSALFFWECYRAKREIRHLEKIREDIICEELKNNKDILKRCEKRCEDTGIFKCKKD
jgi:fumarate reductase subunit D